MPRQTPRLNYGDPYQQTAQGGFLAKSSHAGTGDISVQFAQSGTFTTSSTINITPYDTDVSIGAFTVLATSQHDVLLLFVRAGGTFANAQPNDTATIKVVRTPGPTTIDTQIVGLTAQANLAASGDFAIAFNTFDTNVIGPQTYTFYFRIHNGSGNGTFAVTCTSELGFGVDLIRMR